ncbi:hypothetical protein SESBI_12867 [Sesbania bispinosa]|nr:hypothetical protein SESBI_12867 [Sesbania bispinosa]
MTIERITLILHHRGSLLREKGVLKYAGGEMCVWEGIDIDAINRFTVEGLCKEHYYPSDEDDIVVKKKSVKGKGIAVGSSKRMKSLAGRKRKGRACAFGSGNAGTSNRAELEVGLREEDEVVEQETEEHEHMDEDDIF